MKIPADQLEKTKRSGLIYSVDVPVKKDGVYTFRIAVRDKTANRLGTSSQVIEVPNLSKDKLFISGLSISGVDDKGVPLQAESGENAFSSVVSQAISPIRQFSKNSIVAYYYSLYNAKPDAATKLPKVSVQTNLYFDGKMISEGKPEITELKKDTNSGLIKDFGYIKLNSEITYGDYVLQVIVKDMKTSQTVSQWVDFEVIE